MFKKGVQKIRKMTLAEIRFRSNQRIRIELEKLCSRIYRNGQGSVFIPKEIKNALNISNSLPKYDIQFLGLSGDIQRIKNTYQKIFPTCFSKAVKNADNLLAHRFHFFGKDFTFQDPINWTRNPVTGNIYPSQHYSTLRIKETDTYGDIKYAWELNRHQFFIEAGKAYFVTDDERYASKIRDWFLSWTTSNSYKIGVNWTSALESAVRIFSWIWAFYFTRESQIWNAEQKELLIKNLLLQGVFIEENLSHYYSPYNHLIGELAALSFLGTVFPDLPQSKKWRDKYWGEMEEQFERQFHPDGFTVEQASYYHHFTLGFYLMVALLRKQNNLPVSQMIWDKLEQALEVVMFMTRPDGHLPMIGDIDNARSIYFYFPEDQWNLRAFLSLGAVIFNRGDMKYAAGDVSEEVLWLLGQEGVEKYQQLPRQTPESTSKAFQDSGYFIMRDGWEEDSNYCCFDCGEIAHGVHKDDTPSAAHGHADILSYELCIDGKPLIIDPGLPTYFGPLEWHRYFRSTQAHNSITVNNCGQAQHEGRISWSRVSSPKLITWFSNSHLDFVGGAIDKFANMEEDIFHRRYILNRKPHYFLMMDEVASANNSDRKFRVNSFLHFSEGDLQSRGLIFSRNGEKVLVLSLMPETKIRIEAGGNQPYQGWIAPGYGYRMPAPLIDIESENQLPVRMGMLFPTKHLKETLISFTFSGYQEHIIQFKIESKDWQETVFLNPSKRVFEIEQPQPIQTDALCLGLKGDHHSIRELFAITLSNLVVGSRKIRSNELSGLRLEFDNHGQHSVEEWK